MQPPPGIVEIQEHPSTRVVNHLLRNGYQLLTAEPVTFLERWAGPAQPTQPRILRRMSYIVGRTADVPSIFLSRDDIDAMFEDRRERDAVRGPTVGEVGLPE